MKNSEIKTIENLKRKDKNYTIRWQLTSLCNYYCDFCIQGNKNKHIEESKGESAQIRAKICTKIIKFIENELNDKYKTISLYLIGGEVTILKDFITILTNLANVKFKGIINYYITTNLSLSKEQLKNITNIFKGLDNRILNISANYYQEYTNQKEFMEKIKYIRNKHPKINSLVLKKAKYENKIIAPFINFLAKRNYNIKINIGYPLVEDADYLKYQEFYEKYKKYASSIVYIIIRDYHKSISATLKQKLNRNNQKWLKVTNQKNQEFYFYNTSDLALNVEGGFNPCGMLCDSGVNSISIDNLGIISRCVSCNELSVVGNALKKDIKLIKDEFICPSKRCMCNYFGFIKNK